MDFSKYLFRCHMVGKIIDVPTPLTEKQNETFIAYLDRASGNGIPLTQNQKIDLDSLQHKYNQSKIYKLSESTKNTLSELAFAEKYKRKVEINSKMMTKGLDVEKYSRDILSRVSGLFLTACNERKYNDWVTGQIDIEPDNVIIDIKSSWSWESFTKILQEKPNELYLRQGDSYMDLWGVKEFLLCYILTDTPAKLVDGELRKADYNNNIMDFEGNIRDENIEDAKKIVTNHIFSRKALEQYCDQSAIIHIEWFDDFVEIPERDRVHMIPHSFDEERIEQRNKCILLARDYMSKCTPINNFKPELLK